MKKFFLVLVLGSLIAGGWYAAHRRSRDSSEKAGLSERFTARVEKRDIDSTVEISGEVTPAFELEVKAEVGGKIKALHVEPGDIVKEGQVLVEVDDRDLLTEKDNSLTEIEGARLSMDKTRKNFERSKELFDANRFLEISTVSITH